MTQAQQKKFVRELIKNVQKEVIGNVPNMPNYWDGIELRQYIADKFANSVMCMTRPRKRDYDNTIMVTNL